MWDQLGWADRSMQQCHLGRALVAWAYRFVPLTRDYAVCVHPPVRTRRVASADGSLTMITWGRTVTRVARNVQTVLPSAPSSAGQVSLALTVRSIRISLP